MPQRSKMRRGSSSGRGPLARSPGHGSGIGEEFDSLPPHGTQTAGLATTFNWAPTSAEPKTSLRKIMRTSVLGDSNRKGKVKDRHTISAFESQLPKVKLPKLKQKKALRKTKSNKLILSDNSRAIGVTSRPTAVGTSTSSPRALSAGAGGGRGREMVRSNPRCYFLVCLSVCLAGTEGFTPICIIGGGGIGHEFTLMFVSSFGVRSRVSSFDDVGGVWCLRWLLMCFITVRCIVLFCTTGGNGSLWQARESWASRHFRLGPWGCLSTTTTSSGEEDILLPEE